MLQWLTAKVSGAEAPDLNPSEQAKIEHMVGMGFETSPARFALRQCEGNVDRAVDLLLSGAMEQQDSASVSARSRAAQAAMNRRQSAGSKSTSSGRSNKSSSTVSRTLTATSDAAKVAARALKPRSFDQKLSATVGHISDSPAAVDMLLYIVQTILNNPGERKFREIKATNTRFRSTIGTAGRHGIAFLELLGFKRAGDWYVLRGQEDSAKLWMGKTALENVISSSPVYAMAKDREAFEKALKESLNSANKEEAKRRQQFENAVPTEPEEGRAGTTRITVFCGAHVLQRRFNSDDVVENVISWLGATHSSLIPGNLYDKSWELVDKTLFPPRVVDLDKDQTKTLQAAMMWPGAELVVQTAGTFERQQSQAEGAAAPLHE